MTLLEREVHLIDGMTGACVYEHTHTKTHQSVDTSVHGYIGLQVCKYGRQGSNREAFSVCLSLRVYNSCYPAFVLVWS